MSHILNDLSADFAAIKQREEEMARSGQPFQFAPMEPYSPSETVLNLNREQTEYYQKVKHLSFGQY